MANISPYLGIGILIFGVGADIWKYALRLSEVVGINGKVICFEPDIKNYSFLQFNVSINKIKNVVCSNIGLGEKTEIIELYCETLTGGRMSSFEKNLLKKSFKVLQTLYKSKVFTT